MHAINLDRSGFQEDWNVVFPLDRLRELAAEGVIGSVAATQYSFMGATDPVQMESYAREVASRLKDGDVAEHELIGPGLLMGSPGNRGRVRGMAFRL